MPGWSVRSRVLSILEQEMEASRAEDGSSDEASPKTPRIGSEELLTRALQTYQDDEELQRDIAELLDGRTDTRRTSEPNQTISRSSEVEGSVPARFKDRLRYAAADFTGPAAERLDRLFLELQFDRETQDFLDWCEAQFARTVRTAYLHGLLRPMLSYWMSHSDLNAYLDIGHMHLLSTQQVHQLLQATQFPFLDNRIDGHPDDPNGEAEEEKKAWEYASHLRADREERIWLLDIGAVSRNGEIADDCEQGCW